MVRLHPLTFQKIILLLSPGFPLERLLISFLFGVILSSDACWKRPKNGAAGPSSSPKASDSLMCAESVPSIVRLVLLFSKGVRFSYAWWKRPKYGAAGPPSSPKASDSLMRAESVPSIVQLVFLFSKGVRLSYACWKRPKYHATGPPPFIKKPTLSYLTFLSSTLPTWEDNSPVWRASIIHVSPASSGLPFLNIVFITSKYPLNLSFFHAKTTLVIFFLHSFPSIRSTISTCMGAYLLSFLVHFLPYVLSSSNHLESILQPAEYFLSIITHENSSF